MLRPAWLCHQRRAVGFSVAQFQPDFIFDAVRGLFSPLLVGVAPAIPTTPSNLDADCVAIFNRVMIGGLRPDRRGVRRSGAAWTNNSWRGPLRPNPTVPIRFGWCYADAPPPRPQGPNPPRWRSERRPDGKFPPGGRPLDGSCSRKRGEGGGHRDNATTIEDGARLHAEGEWTRKNCDVKWIRWRTMLGNDSGTTHRQHGRRCSHPYHHHSVLRRRVKPKCIVHLPPWAPLADKETQPSIAGDVEYKNRPEAHVTFNHDTPYDATTTCSTREYSVVFLFQGW